MITKSLWWASSENIRPIDRMAPSRHIPSNKTENIEECDPVLNSACPTDTRPDKNFLCSFHLFHSNYDIYFWLGRFYHRVFETFREKGQNLAKHGKSRHEKNVLMHLVHLEIVFTCTHKVSAGKWVSQSEFRQDVGCSFGGLFQFLH
mgnify:CR=1 FL=1